MLFGRVQSHAVALLLLHAAQLRQVGALCMLRQAASSGCAVHAASSCVKWVRCACCVKLRQVGALCMLRQAASSGRAVHAASSCVKWARCACSHTDRGTLDSLSGMPPERHFSVKQNTGASTQTVYCSLKRWGAKARCTQAQRAQARCACAILLQPNPPFCCRSAAHPILHAHPTDHAPPPALSCPQLLRSPQPPRPAPNPRAHPFLAGRQATLQRGPSLSADLACPARSAPLLNPWFTLSAGRVSCSGAGASPGMSPRPSQGALLPSSRLEQQQPPQQQHQHGAQRQQAMGPLQRRLAALDACGSGSGGSSGRLHKPATSSPPAMTSLEVAGPEASVHTSFLRQACICHSCHCC